jgi:hypothetical protein
LTGSGVTPSLQQTANPFESRTAGEAPVLQTVSFGDALVIEPTHGDVLPAALEESLQGRWTIAKLTLTFFLRR